MRELTRSHRGLPRLWNSGLSQCCSRICSRSITRRGGVSKRTCIDLWPDLIASRVMDVSTFMRSISSAPTVSRSA